MRVCRYLDQGQPAFGFYLDGESLIPLDVAAEHLHLAPLPAESLLDLLPGGSLRRRVLEMQSRLGMEAVSPLSQPLGTRKLLTPLPSPGKIVCLAGNYADHVVEQGGRAEERARTFPYLFLKPASTLTHPGDPIRIPAVSPNKIDWEVELGVVIGRECRQVSESQALDYVAGYTVINDISDRGFRPNSQRTARPKDQFFDWQHGKWHDTFCPLGPCILPADECPDPQSLRLTLTVSGVREQDGSTAAMIFPVAAIIEFVSALMTLHPGDMISTGTPDGVGNAKGKFLKSGDVVEAEIEKLGVLRNPVI